MVSGTCQRAQALFRIMGEQSKMLKLRNSKRQKVKKINLAYRKSRSRVSILCSKFVYAIAIYSISNSKISINDSEIMSVAIGRSSLYDSHLKPKILRLNENKRIFYQSLRLLLWNLIMITEYI